MYWDKGERRGVGNLYTSISPLLSEEYMIIFLSSIVQFIPHLLSIQEGLPI
jgi:hypothetical protein